MEVNQETIYKKNDGIVAAKHNGFVKAIEHNGTAVYAAIEYTDDPTLVDGVPEDSKFETIQVSSYITKVDETFRVCPKCGRRISRDEYANLYTTGFVDEEGNPKYYGTRQYRNNDGHLCRSNRIEKAGGNEGIRKQHEYILERVLDNGFFLGNIRHKKGQSTSN